MEQTERMAGDRGLALVVIGVIGISVVWRIGDDRPRGHSPAGVSESSVILGDLPGPRGGGGLSDFTNRVTGDYRLFQQRLERLAGMKDTRTESALGAEFYFPALADSDEGSPNAERTGRFPQSLDNSIR